MFYTHAGPETVLASTKAYLAEITAAYLLVLYLAQLRGTILRAASVTPSPWGCAEAEVNRGHPRTPRWSPKSEKSAARGSWTLVIPEEGESSPRNSPRPRAATAAGAVVSSRGMSDEAVKAYAEHVFYAPKPFTFLDYLRSLARSVTVE